jgi:hypothetical protein
MTAQDFRRIVAGLRGASESSHMEYPDFRVDGKVFATFRLAVTIPYKNIASKKSSNKQKQS